MAVVCDSVWDVMGSWGWRDSMWKVKEHVMVVWGSAMVCNGVQWYCEGTVRVGVRIDSEDR